MKLALLFPVYLRETLNSLDEMEDLEEIRIRIGQPLFLYAGQKELFLENFLTADKPVLHLTMLFATVVLKKSLSTK